MSFFTSFKKYKWGILIMLCSSIFACVGQLLWKMSGGFTNNIFLVLLGFVFYGIGAILMIFAYKFGPLSVLQPILSLNYVFSLILGYFILNEPIDILKVLGILVIISGVCLIAMGGNKNATPKEKVNEQKENANE